MARSAMSGVINRVRETEAGSDVGVEVPPGILMTGNHDRTGKDFHRDLKSGGAGTRRKPLPERESERRER